MNREPWNQTLCENINRIQLRIYRSGHTVVGDEWNGTFVNPIHSRLYYMIRGNSYIISPKGERIPLEEGNCYLLPTGYTFTCGCDTFMEQVYFHLILCDFDGIDLLEQCAQPLMYTFPPEKSEVYKELAHTQSLVGGLAMQQEIFASLLTMWEKYQIELKRNDYSSHIRQAIKFINANLSIQLKLTDIAAHVFLAPSTLTRKFKAETGMTVGQYIDESIMSAAEQMLVASEASVAEISEKFGFYDQAYFARRFRGKFGMAPAHYRHTVLN